MIYIYIFKKVGIKKKGIRGLLTEFSGQCVNPLFGLWPAVNFEKLNIKNQLTVIKKKERKKEKTLIVKLF